MTHTEISPGQLFLWKKNPPFRDNDEPVLALEQDITYRYSTKTYYYWKFLTGDGVIQSIELSYIDPMPQSVSP